MYSKIKITGRPVHAILMPRAGLILTIIAGFFRGHLIRRQHVEINHLTSEEIEAATHEGEIAIR